MSLYGPSRSLRSLISKRGGICQNQEGCSISSLTHHYASRKVEVISARQTLHSDTVEGQARGRDIPSSWRLVLGTRHLSTSTEMTME